MDVRGLSRDQKELESTRRLLKARDEEHAAEIDKLRGNQKEQIATLKESQKNNIERITDNSKENINDLQADYNTDLDRITDYYERELREEAKTNYDRTGKLIADHQHQLDKDRDFRSKQFDDYKHQNDKVNKNASEDYERKLNNTRMTSYNNLREMEKYVDNKLEEQRKAHAAGMTQGAEETKERIDKNIRQTRTDIAREKAGANLRYEKLAKQTEAERDNLVKKFKIREQQLSDARESAEKRLGSDNAKVLEDYKKSMSANLEQTVNDNNFTSALKDQANASRIASIDNDHRLKDQQLRSQFQKAESELRHQNRIEKDRDEIRNSLNEKRHKQELFLATEGLRKGHELSAERLKESFEEALLANDEKHQKQMQERSQTVEKKFKANAQHAAETATELQHQKAFEVGQISRKHDLEKNHLINQYERKSQMQNDLKNRQLTDQEREFLDKLERVQEDKDLTIYRTHRDNQAKLFALNENYKNRVNELLSMNDDRQVEREQAYQGKTDRLKKTYDNSLRYQKEHFDDATTELKLDSKLISNKIRSDYEHEKRVQLMEMQHKNRALLAESEKKINQLIDEHSDEVFKMREEGEKAIRESMKRAKELVDYERTAHKRELDTREAQWSEKLKLQKENFEEQIAKLKRTNELSIKKG